MIFDGKMKKVPVILDTDIGGDIDDSWALSFLLKSPEVELKQIIAATGDAEYKAKVAARMLQIAGRQDIPLAIGRTTTDSGRTVERWLEEFSWDNYEGRIERNGAQQLVNAVHAQEKSPVILCIGPMTNPADALELDPSIAEKAHLVAMSGSFEKRENGKPGQIAEWNVRVDIESAQKVFSAPWKSIQIAPLDSCGDFRLDGDFLQKVKESECPQIRALLDSVDIWEQHVKFGHWPKLSPILFDVVAAYLCFGSDYLKIERKNLKVDDDGFMRDGPATVDCALDWTDRDGFKRMLADRLA